MEAASLAAGLRANSIISYAVILLAMRVFVNGLFTFITYAE